MEETMQPDGNETARPCAMVIFGAAGDLTKRLVVPALYNLVVAGRLPDSFRLVGCDLVAKTSAEWQNGLLEMMQECVAKGDGEFQASRIDPAHWGWLASRMTYLQGDLNDPGCYARLDEHLSGLDKTAGTGGNRLFYLAVSDRFFGPIVDHLGAAGLTREAPGQWRHVVIEKPFGHDLASATALNTRVGTALEERQIYRIDHFLGKETVQNILIMRLANGLFEPIWNRTHIDHVQITAAETVGVERRGRFYEKTGALRDMIPNHMFQLLAMTAMEPPVSFDADEIRNKKSDLLRSIRPLRCDETLADAVRGQYAAGTVLGRTVRDYRSEPDVAADSNAETYVACRIMIDNWRWSDVPFYLRTGKYLAARKTEIAIRFRSAPLAVLKGIAPAAGDANWLVLRIQPNEGMSIEFAAKRPGPKVSLGAVRMDFSYKDYFHAASGTGYETLIYDCMNGDATLFKRADNVEAGWRVVQPLLDAWASTPPDGFPNYVAGSDGPAAADALLARDGNSWRPLT
jgi:glucose-6-phosphate 1-dehydrogenase